MCSMSEDNWFSSMTELRGQSPPALPSASCRARSAMALIGRAVRAAHSGAKSRLSRVRKSAR
jgi:hypothetical protein